MASRFGVVFSLFVLASSIDEDVEKCPGDTRLHGDPRRDYRCNHDETHRVCAKLVDRSDDTCTRHMWGDKNFWQLTNQTEVEWKDKVCNPPNPGEYWCICMWATATLIDKVGCENISINCGATSIKHIMSKKVDGNQKLDKEKECLRQKCPNHDFSIYWCWCSRLQRTVSPTSRRSGTVRQHAESFFFWLFATLREAHSSCKGAKHIPQTYFRRCA